MYTGAMMSATAMSGAAAWMSSAPSPGAAQPDGQGPVAALFDSEPTSQVVVHIQGARQRRREGEDKAVAADGRRGKEDALLDVVYGD
jgi:hypothetical protein